MKSTVKPRDSDDESDDQYHDYEDLESDVEDSDDDILKNLNPESDDSSSEEEVLPIHSDSDSDADDVGEGESEEDENNDVSDSDIDHEEDDLPDSKAWGKNKKTYYNADNINDKTNFFTEEDEEATKMEEEEARIIQKRLVSGIDATDLTFDLLTDVIAEKKEQKRAERSEEKGKIEIDLSQMSEQEKMILLKKESPELLTYIDDYKRLMTCVRDELLPVIKMLQKMNATNTSFGLFILSFRDLVLNFCTNITFYILLKLRKVDTKNHPCSTWLNQYKNVLTKSEQVYEKTFKSQIESILKFKSKSELTSSRIKSLKPKNMATLKPKVEKFSLKQDVDEPVISDDENENEMDRELADGKRPITYQIAKNKGLTPHRKKELRNPRVKHRMKYRKAKIRRKGQVREVRKEMKKYDGEISGIKASVVKSVKFKG